MLLGNRTSSCAHNSFLIFCALFISVYSRKNVKRQIETESLILLETVCRSCRYQLLNHNKIINTHGDSWSLCLCTTSNLDFSYIPRTDAVVPWYYKTLYKTTIRCYTYVLKSYTLTKKSCTLFLL